MTRQPLIYVAILTLLCCGWIVSSRPAVSSGSTVYIALGDSIAAGIGSSLPRERGYSALIRDLISRESGRIVTLENLATPGETVTSFRDDGQLSRFHDLVDRLNRGNTPISAITVSLGGNDMLHVSGRGSTDRQAALDGFTSAYPAVLSDIRSAVGNDIPIIVTNSYDLSSGDSSIVESDAWWIARFNDVIAAGAAASSARVADVSSEFAGHISDYTLAPWDVHPTNAGHQAIAAAVWRALAIDTIAPVVTVTPTLISARRMPTLRFTANDNTGIDDIEIRSSGGTIHGPFQTGTNTWVVLVDLGDVTGIVTVTIKASDLAGNTVSRDVTITPPAGTP